MSAEPTTRPGPSVQVPVPLRVASGYIWRILLIGLGIYVLGRVAGYFSVLVVPLLIAILLTALLGPLVDLLDRRMPRGLAVLISMLVALAILSGLFTLVGTQVASQLGELTRQALAGLAKLQEWLANGPLGVGTHQLNEYLKQITDTLSANSAEVGRRALTATATAGEILTGLALSIFSLIFLLLDGRRIWLWLVAIVPRAGRERVDLAGRSSWSSLTAYVRATVMVAAVDALGIGIGAVILGVPLAVPLAVLVFIGAFVPIIGAVVTGAVAVLVALLTLGFAKALIMLAIVLAVQQLESQVLQPFLLGRMVQIHPLAVVLAIGAGVIINGIVGALFAVPLVAVVNAFVQSVKNPDAVAAQLEPDPASERESTNHDPGVPNPSSGVGSGASRNDP